MPLPVFRGVPLPILTNEKHFKRVLTHRSVVAISASVRVAETPPEDYERWVKGLNGVILDPTGLTAWDLSVWPSLEKWHLIYVLWSIYIRPVPSLGLAISM